MRDDFLKILYAPPINDGGENPDVLTENPEKDPGVDPPQELGKEQPPINDGFVPPKFFSQFKHDRRDTEDYKSFVGKYENLTDLADRLVSLEKTNKNAIIPPSDNASFEEVAEYLNKLGVPLDEKDYVFEKSIVNEDVEKELKESLVPQFHKLGLTKRQANGMMKLIEQNYVNNIKELETEIEDKKTNFESRFSNLFSDVSDNESARNEYSEKMFNYATSFLAKSDLINEFKETGLLFDPKIMRKIAEYEKTTSTPPMPNSLIEDASENKGFKYGKDFEDFVKGIK